MNDQSWKRKEDKEPCPGLVFGKTTVIVLVIRGRRAYDNCHPFLRDKGKKIRAKG
jgi:hypothetical protein